MEDNKKRLRELRNTNRKYKSHLKEVLRKGRFKSFNTAISKEQRAGIAREEEILKRRKETVLRDFGHFITPGSGSIHIMIPQNFCFCTHYDQSLAVIKDFASGIYDYVGLQITVDFTNCLQADTAALFVLQIIRLEMLGRLNFLQKQFQYINVIPEIKVKQSTNIDVLRLLIATGFPIKSSEIKNSDIENAHMHPIDSMGYLKGKASQKHYQENKKPVYTRRIVKYLGSCLGRHGYMLTDEDVNRLDGIMGEVLSNAEDHSETNSWYITANFSSEIIENSEDMTGELNLTIMNFGLSFYESFNKTKNANHETFNRVESRVNHLIQKNLAHAFDKQQIFTLFMMSDGISRLKFKEKSRGTGTMKFLNSFVEIGDFVDHSKKFVPNLSIFSGHTHLICDHVFKPFLKETVYCLSLNPEQDLNVAPRASHLKKLKEPFPGTLLSVKIYLNKNHLDLKYGGNGHEVN